MTLPIRLLLASACTLGPLSLAGQSVARMWNEQNLAAIRVDFPNPVVHARNLFHTSIAMYDAWAAFDPVSVGYLHREEVTADPAELEVVRAEAISYAAFRVLHARYTLSVNAEITLPLLEQQMRDLGYDPTYTGTEGTTAAALGNRIGQTVLQYYAADGSNESIIYFDPSYPVANPPLILAEPGTTMFNPNRWQPLQFKDGALTQNGQPAPLLQTFIGSQWGRVRPFALHDTLDLATAPLDPGPPPLLGTETDALFKEETLEVILFSSLLDPRSELIDISPGALGNNPLGTNEGTGHDLNPVTGQPYPENLVPRGDYARVVAEYWADGPDSETPPGHWNKLANSVNDALTSRRIGGTGPEVDALEWDVKLYFTLNAAAHDAAVAAWGCKRVYDYVRPISAIRYLGGNGQSSDPQLPSYDPAGLPLRPGLVELVTTETADAGGRHAGLTPGKVAILAWGGEPEDNEETFAGVTWIHPEEWFPYQMSTFVTPSFAGYVSGHSTFSRAAAEVLAAYTGSPYFPGGVGTFTAKKDAYLEFERGPSVDVVLQWATYFDASDQSGISRIYGGIHFPVDDGPGRIMGAQCGRQAWALAQRYFDGSILHEVPATTALTVDPDQGLAVRWNGRRGLFYRVESGPDPLNFDTIEGTLRSQNEGMILDLAPPEGTATRFYRIVPLSRTDESQGSNQ